VKQPTGRQQINLAALERRVLDAARKEQPSAELSARMASGLGLSAAALSRAGALEPVGSPTGQEVVAASKGAPFWGTWVPWVSGAVVVVTAVGAVVATRPSAAPPTPHELPALPRQGPSEAPADPAVVLPVNEAASAPKSEARESIVQEAASARKVSSQSEKAAALPAVRPASATSLDLRAEIALIDAARGAMQSGAHGRALGLLNDYEMRYPKGSFRPEAMVLRIEALAKMGQQTEASRLAQRFVAKHVGSPLAERVAKYQ
jgi:hypothetical protein